MRMKCGKFYATMKMERSVDPTPEEIEERKREVWRDHLKQKLDIEVVDPIQGGHYLHQKYLEIAHKNTYHDVFNDVRTGHDKPTQFQCDCPYWEHDRRNPEC